MGAYVMVLNGRNAPVDNVLIMHVLDGIDYLRCIVPRARQGQRPQARYPRLHFAVWCKIQHENCLAWSVAARARNGRHT